MSNKLIDAYFNFIVIMINCSGVTKSSDACLSNWQNRVVNNQINRYIGAVMYKLVIVEDENDVRNRISSLIRQTDAKFSIANEYATAIDAYEDIMSDCPDLILTDIKMPHMSGIELAKAVREAFPFAKIVFITGYNEFEYAKEAANLGVTQFINKPVSFEEIESVLQKTRRMLDNEYITAKSRSKMSDFYENYLPIIKGNDLYRLSQLQEPSPSFLAKLKANGISLDYAYFMVSIFDFDESYDEEEQRDFAFSSFGKVIEEELKDIFDYDVFFRHGKLCLILKTNSSPKVADVSKLFEHMTRRVGRYSDMQASVGISQVHENMNFREMFKEAMNALRLRSIMGGQKVFLHEDISIDTPKVLTSNRHVRDLGHMLHFNSLGECLATLDEIWASGQNFNVPEVYVSTSILNALIKACENLDDLYISFGSIDSMYSFIFENRDSDKVLEYLRKLAKSVVEVNNKTITDDVDRNLQRIVDFLETNFCDPGISLSTMSKEIHLSVSYISTLLKRKLNTSFVKMLTDLRMKRAKILLRDQSLKIVDVAEQLGFSNSYYFSHSFKKYTGLSPREYKSQ